MNLHTDTFPTPFGLFSVATDPGGALVATAFGDLASLRSRLTAFAGDFQPSRDTRSFDRIREQVLAYCAGDRRTFGLPLAPQGTDFQHRVWTALQQIPFGETRGYGQLAAALGRPTAARAVGRANATNPICLVIPCHRVIGADGSLTGFAFGEELKRRLLALERDVVARRAA